MPFLRYRTGDLGRLCYEKCSCGETSPILSQLSGRLVPVFRLPGGKLFSPTQFRDTFDKFRWLKEFQMIHEKTNLVRILYEQLSNEEVSLDEEQRFQHHFSRQLGSSVTVYLQKHVFLPNCKFQRYKTLLD
jgi:phenylacetate-coenzyme A ligase PaaK-like adenylate-forming protein